MLSNASGRKILFLEWEYFLEIIFGSQSLNLAKLFGLRDYYDLLATDAGIENKILGKSKIFLFKMVQQPLRKNFFLTLSSAAAEGRRLSRF